MPKKRVESVVKEDDGSPKGLYYFEDAVPKKLYTEIVRWLEHLNLESVSSVGSRKVAQFGYQYEYKKRNVKRLEIVDLPDILVETRDLLNQYIDFSRGDATYFNQVLINRYLPGEGISAHIDAPSLFKGAIACFTIGSGVEIEFTRDTELYRLYVKPNSLYVMTGESRYEWKHAIRPRLKDDKMIRGVRYSITFRGVKQG